MRARGRQQSVLIRPGCTGSTGRMTILYFGVVIPTLCSLYPQDLIDMRYVTNIRHQRQIDGQEASDPSDA